jgi:hypothetical protein
MGEDGLHPPVFYGRTAIPAAARCSLASRTLYCP